MSSMTKRFFAMILAFMMVFFTNTTVFAAEDNSDICIAQKTAVSVDDKGRYEVEIQVPGEDGTEGHDEVIMMIDGSYSLDSNWTTTRNGIIEVGKAVLEGDGNTVITVMTFGMGDNVVVEHIKSVSELESSLTDLPGGLLYGRSSTNCEAGFTGIEEYIDNHDETLKSVSVIYITDGQINTDETEYAFYNWTENTWLKAEPATLARYSLAEGLAIYESGTTVLSNAYTTTFGENIYNSNDVETGSAVTDEELMAWASLVWDDVYEYSEMEHETAYTVSDAERAFVKYDKENGTHVQEVFYFALWGRTYSNMESRTVSAGLELANHNGVEHLYLVDCNTTTAWMANMADSANNISFYEAGSISNLVNTLEGVISRLENTPYNDVIVTDYMSKWVNLDTTTIKVVDNNKGESIWNSTEGWLISENRPTNQEVPVVVTEVTSDEYEAGGSDVVGNTQGTIYKLTWYVKDGSLLRNDNYSLVYEIDVDTVEDGFEYGKDYPANGNTTITYSTDGNEITEDIDVPNVVVSKNCDDDENKPGCGDKPNDTEKPDCGNKPDDTQKPGCGNNQNNNQKPGCGNNQNNNQKPGCGNNQNNNQKPGCGNNQNNTQKPGCGNKPGNIQKPGCGNIPSNTQKPGCGNKPGNTQKPSCGNTMWNIMSI